MTVRILVFIVIAIIAVSLTFNGNLPRTALTDKIGIQAIRHVFDSI